MPIGQVLFLTKRTRIGGAIWIGSALVNLGLNLLVVPRWGIMGAALTTVAAYELGLILTTYYSFKEMRFNVERLFIGKSVVASTIMSAAIWAIAPQRTIDTILAVVAGVLIYGAALLLLKGFKKEEVSFFRGLFRASTPAQGPEERKVR